MNPNYFNEEDDFNQILFYDPKDINQRTKRHHTTISNSNNDNFKPIQEQKLFNLNPLEQLFQKQMEKQMATNNEQNQGNNTLGAFLKNPLRIKEVQNQTQLRQPEHNQYQPSSQNVLQNYQTKTQNNELQEHFQQKKSNTLEICSVCLQPKSADHQCNDEYGLIACPYCSDHIVRNFLKDHLEECIPYIEQQFKNLDKVEECAICMEDLRKDKQTLRCSHTFHKTCVDGWKQKSKECPVCRKPI